MASLEMTSNIIYRDKDDYSPPEWFQNKSFTDLHNPYFDYEMVPYNYECTVYTILTSWIEESNSSTKQSSDGFSSRSSKQSSEFYTSESIEDSIELEGSSTNFASLMVIIPALFGIYFIQSYHLRVSISSKQFCA